MFDRFNPFGNHLALESLSQADNAFDDGQVFRVVKHVADEGLVNFQHFSRQAAEVGERGVTRTKIVEGETNAQGATFGEQCGDQPDIFQYRSFENFELKPTRLDARIGREQFAQTQGKTGVLQMVTGDVDTDRKIKPLRRPGIKLLQGFTDHPVAKFDGQFAALDDVEKLARQKQATFRVVPANQGFGTDHTTQAHIHFRLVIKGELAIGQTITNLPQLFTPNAGPAVVFRIEKMMPIAPGLLGSVHRLIGMA